MEELLQFFKEKEVSLQITLDINERPTVHAIEKEHGLGDLEFASGETLVEALKNMKWKLFDQHTFVYGKANE